MPADARILDVGCGDGFHLDLLRTYGFPGWTLEGVDADARAVAAARGRGLNVHEGTIEDAGFDAGSFDAVILIQTIEHVPEPADVLRAINHVLKPGGRLLVVTDNTASPDFKLFGKRHWGGYHFPRHLHLFDPGSLARLAEHTGFRVDRIRTITSPVNWVYSVRNTLADFGASESVLSHLSLSAPIALGFGTVFDTALRVAGRGALLQAELVAP
jgi:SAM-dependent methyltransferase